MRPGRRHLVVVAVAVLIGAGACGLPEDDRPRLVADADAPIDLVPTTASVVDETGEETAEVFFMNAEQDRLSRVLRAVDAVTVDAAVAALLAGPGEGENLLNLIPPGVILNGVDVEEGIATIDLGPAGEGGIQAVQGLNQVRALAQFVFTAMGVEGVDGVRFLVEGEPFDAITEAGATSEPVRREDYASLTPAAG